MKSSSKTLIRIIHEYDGENSLDNFLSSPWAKRQNTYQRLWSHASELGLEVGIVPEGSKLMLNITITL